MVRILVSIRLTMRKLRPMTRSDWLVGGDRRTAAAERIYAAATDLIARDGMDAFDIDALASRVHCSRATIYRCAGGKRQIRDAVMERSAARIVDAVRLAVDGLSGAERIVTAITVALGRDPIGSAGSADVQRDSGRRGKGVAHRISDRGTARDRPQRADRRRHRSGAVDRPRRAVAVVLAHRRRGRRASRWSSASSLRRSQRE